MLRLFRRLHTTPTRHILENDLKRLNARVSSEAEIVRMESRISAIAAIACGGLGFTTVGNSIPVATIATIVGVVELIDALKHFNRDWRLHLIKCDIVEVTKELHRGESSLEKINSETIKLFIRVEEEKVGLENDV